MSTQAEIDGHGVGKVILAPFLISWTRRLQTACVAVFLFSFTGLPIVLLLTTVYIGLFTAYWPWVALYMLWFVADFRTPERAPRISQRVRDMWYWKKSAEYFPISLHKTVDLDPTRNYIFGYHPHGIICTGAAHCFGANACGFTKKFPGLRSMIVMLDFWFKIPFYREYIMNALIPHQKRSILNYLKQSPSGGQVAVLVVGGAPEALMSKPGPPEIILGKRKGFVKMALQLGVDLVPVFAFGEHEIWDQGEQPKEGTLAYKFNSWFTSKTGAVLPAFGGRGIFNYNKGMLPHRRPIHIVVGAPIRLSKTDEPSQELIDNTHAAYVAALQKVYDDNAANYLPREENGAVRKLTIH